MRIPTDGGDADAGQQSSGTIPASDFAISADEHDAAESDARFHAPSQSQLEMAGASSASVSTPAAVASSNNSSFWYLHLPDGQRLGPARSDEVENWLRQGQVPGDALVWRDGWPQWKLASVVFAEPQTIPTALGNGPPDFVLPSPELDRSASMLDSLPGSVVPSQAVLTHRRSRRYPNAKVTFVLIGLVIVLFALMLYVFFVHDDKPMTTTRGNAPQVNSKPEMLARLSFVPVTKLS